MTFVIKNRLWENIAIHITLTIIKIFMELAVIKLGIPEASVFKSKACKYEQERTNLFLLLTGQLPVSLGAELMVTDTNGL
jgi:hypothetical protein